MKNESQPMDRHCNLIEKDGSDGRFRLLYHSRRYGVSSTTFHCKSKSHDGEGCNLTIIKATDGFIVGGYSYSSLNDRNKRNDTPNKAFFFALSETEPCKILKSSSSSNIVFFANGQPQDTMTLNVGGTVVVTSQTALQLCKESAISSKFLGEGEMRNVYSFEKVLDHLNGNNDELDLRDAEKEEHEIV